MLQGAYPGALFKIGVVRGIEPEAPHHLHVPAAAGKEGGLDALQGGGVLFQLPPGEKLDGVPVAHAVEIDDGCVFLHALVPFREGGGAQHTLFLVVEEHEAHPVPVLGGQGQGGLQQGEHAAGVVVGGVLVGPAVDEPPHEKRADGYAGQWRQPPRRRFRNECKDEPLRCRHHEKQRQHDERLVEYKEKQVAGRDEIGDGQHSLGVVVGGEQHLRFVRVAHDDIPGGKALLHTRRVSRLFQLPAQPGAEGRLLLFGFAHLHFVQDFSRLLRHLYPSTIKSAADAPTRAMRPAGFTSTWKPTFPADTHMVSSARQLSWNTVGKRFFIPTGEQPPWT